MAVTKSLTWCSPCYLRILYALNGFSVVYLMPDM